jgi:hypothetical protein
MAVGQSLTNSRLDVSQHLQLCRLYVRRLHRSLVDETPEIEKASKRSSYMQDLNDAGEGPSNEKDMLEDSHRAGTTRHRTARGAITATIHHVPASA